jgi:uncharacterized SAM-binding protein YcdF (DUF218 family)
MSDPLISRHPSFQTRLSFQAGNHYISQRNGERGHRSDILRDNPIESAPLFFYVAKILWMLLQPTSLIAAALVIGLILTRTAWRRLGRRLLTCGVVAFLGVGLLPVGEWLFVPLESRFPRTDLERGPPPAGIIVLGGAEDSRVDPPRELAGLNESAERYTEAVALSRRFPQARIVFTGGSGLLLRTGTAESVTANRLLQALGVGQERLTLEGRARDTYENAILTKALVDPKSGERWLLVTSAWHMPRAIGCFRRAGFAVEPWPVDYRTGGRLRLWPGDKLVDGLRELDAAAREYAGLLMYYLSGRTDSLFPRP